jgi:pimeloyl-ACP methyl ester carboxylesterase
VPLLKNKVQIWGIDRRSQCLEDTSAFNSSNPNDALGYYLLGTSYNGNKFAAPATDGTNPGAEAARSWGLTVTLEDIRAVVLAAKGTSRTKRNVVLGGHSLGGSLTDLYASWDFNGTPGYSDVKGLVLIDGGARGTFGNAPDATTVNNQIAALSTGSPFSLLIDGLSPSLGYYQGVFPELAAKFATATTGIKNGNLLPKANSAMQSLIASFPAFKSFTSTDLLNNEAQLGYAFDRDTSPQGVKLLQFNMGSLKSKPSNGGARAWQDGGLTDLKDVKTLFGTEPGNFVEWYFPKRLSIDVGAATTLQRSDLTDSLGLRPWHLADVNVPLYAFETGLTCSSRPLPTDPGFAAWVASNTATKCGVLTGAKSFVDASKVPSSTLVSDHDQEHLDPLVARASGNKFQQTVVPFLKTVFGIS